MAVSMAIWRPAAISIVYDLNVVKLDDILKPAHWRQSVQWNRKPEENTCGHAVASSCRTVIQYRIWRKVSRLLCWKMLSVNHRKRYWNGAKKRENGCVTTIEIAWVLYSKKPAVLKAVAESERKLLAKKETIGWENTYCREIILVCESVWNGNAIIAVKPWNAVAAINLTKRVQQCVNDENIYLHYGSKYSTAYLGLKRDIRRNDERKCNEINIKWYGSLKWWPQRKMRGVSWWLLVMTVGSILSAEATIRELSVRQICRPCSDTVWRK